MKRYSTTMLLTFLMISLGCTNSEFVTEEELKEFAYNPDNGITKSKSVKDIDIRVTYKPTDLLVAQEVGSRVQTDSSGLIRIKNKYSNYHYFLLNLSKADKEALYHLNGGYNQFSNLVQTLSFRMGDYINLVTSDYDTIPVVDYVYPRTFGMGASTTLMLAFNKEQTENMEWVQFDMEEFGMGLGRQRFQFETRHLETIPGIDFSLKLKDLKKLPQLGKTNKY